jgi:NAD-dependent deacetylase
VIPPFSPGTGTRTIPAGTESDSVTRENIESLASEIDRADTVVALTGAGVSTASGIPSFRGDDGIWERFDQRDFHFRRFQTDPEGFWTDRLELRDVLVDDGEITPNAAHEALADVERQGHLDAVVTQNVDGLHQAAGSETVLELHGTNRECECVRCGAREPTNDVVRDVRSGTAVPHCQDCEGVLKPAVVLFGEPMPEMETTRAQELASESDVFLAIGTSLQVQPAAGLPRRARRSDATLAIVNLEPTPLSGRADYDVRADVTEFLPELASRLD